MLTILAIAVLAMAVAIAAWFRAGHASPSYNDSQRTQAKTDLCAAYLTVRQGVVASTHAPNPNPKDPVGTLAVATNARLALLGGGAYLRDRLDAEPAAPSDLANALNSMATTIEQLGLNYLAKAGNDRQAPLRKNLDATIKQLNGLCK